MATQPQKKETKVKTRYFRALKGINYPPDNRVESGEVVSSPPLPPDAANWMVEGNDIVEIDKSEFDGPQTKLTGGGEQE